LQLATKFVNEFFALVSRTAAMMLAAAVLAVDPSDFVLPTFFLDSWRDWCHMAGDVP